MKKILFLLSLILCSSSVFSKKISTFYRNALVFAYDRTNSVFEDENIKLEIYNQKLYAVNKTKKTLFIDLSQCFLNHNGSSYPMFTPDQDEKYASKKGVTSGDEFITIAPSAGGNQNPTFIRNMSVGIFGEYTTSETPWGDMTDYDKRLFEIVNELVVESQKADPKGMQCLGTVSRHLLEDESINNIGASIAYAFNKRAEEWTTVVLSTWVCDVIFTPYYVVIPEDLGKKEKKGFGIKETKPLEICLRADSPYEFDQDKSPLIVCDWVGDFKNGTFKLDYAGILKFKKMGLMDKMLVKAVAASTGIMARDFADYYKNIIVFEGDETDWGKMTYAKQIELTKQDK